MGHYSLPYVISITVYQTSEVYIPSMYSLYIPWYTSICYPYKTGKVAMVPVKQTIVQITTVDKSMSMVLSRSEESRSSQIQDWRTWNLNSYVGKLKLDCRSFIACISIEIRFHFVPIALISANVQDQRSYEFWEIFRFFRKYPSRLKHYRYGLAQSGLTQTEQGNYCKDAQRATDLQRRKGVRKVDRRSLGRLRYRRYIFWFWKHLFT